MKNNYKRIVLACAIMIFSSGIAAASEVSGSIVGGGVVISAPTSSINSGNYNGGQIIILSAPYSESIHYTDDGSIPNCSSKNIFKDEIKISQSQNLKAIACFGDSSYSKISDFTYDIQLPQVSQVLGGSAFVSTKKNLTAISGEVLGASTEASLTSCTPYLSDSIVFGRKNFSGSVMKLQIFLNEEMGSTLPITGFYGPLTRSYVKKLQEKYFAEIFGKDYQGQVTGNVYSMTIKQINIIKCGKSLLTTSRI